MTDEELDIIVERVLAAIRVNSKTVNQLSPVESIADTDYFEISGGRRISYRVLRDLLAAIYESTPSVDGHTHKNLYVLDMLAQAAGYLYLVDGGETNKINAGYADTAGSLADEQSFITKLLPLFLSKVGDDTAEGLITFLKGLKSDGLINANGGAEFGNFIDSMVAGSGGKIDENGNAQLESLQVRGSATFMELIINRLTAVESDFNFTENGTIDSVEELEEGTYLLTLRKRWQYDFTAFDEHDVVYGSINTLLADGSVHTSWFRVLAVNTSANTLTVATYPNDETPAGMNYAPTAGMVINRRGNAINEDRQSCWYISSNEGCIMYLEGVTKPILEESNYYMCLGKPKHLSLFNGLPINYNHPYIFARGAIIQDLLRIDYKGNQIYEIVDLGLWDETTQYMKGYSEDLGAYIQHQVWYKGCCWRCVADEATVGVAPRWNNTQWVCVIGDSNYTLSIDSSKGHFFRFGKEYTTLTYVLKHGDMDISADAWQVEWTRESELTAEDLLWNTEHATCNESVEITPEDMPSNWREVRQVTFRVTITLKEGEETQKLSTEINIS